MIDNREVRLRKPEERDLDLALAWIKNEDHYFAGEDLPLSPEDLREMMLGEIKAPSGYDSNIYRTMETEEGEPVGMVLFHSINWKSRNAFLEAYFPEGEGDVVFAAFIAAIDFAFAELNLHKICICLSEERDSFTRTLDRIGAKEEVVLRRHLFRKNILHTFFLYGLLRSEYEQFKKHLP